MKTVMTMTTPTMNNNPYLLDSEILEDIDGNIKIIANPNLYRYTSDSIRLAKSVKATHKDRILDLCSGSGIIPLALASYTRANIDALEIQYPLFDMARRSVELNSLNDRIRVFNGDLVGYIPTTTYDIVTCNPPYFKTNCGEIRETETADIARHELKCTLSDVVITAEKSLKFGGKLYLLHKCERLSEVLSELTKYKLEPKELLLFTHAFKTVDTFIVIAKKGANVGLKTQIIEI